MEPIKRYSLEDFAERHRADFDLHEPRPELWEMLTKQLEADATTAAGPQLRIAAAETAATPSATPAPVAPLPRLRTQRRWQTVGLAAALGVLLLVAGLGERWKSQQDGQVTATQAPMQPGAIDEALYMGAMPTSEGIPNGNARLDTAVHGMERYYATQLADRQAQLAQLAPENRAEWAQDIAGLDSVYQQLKLELPQHPQPEVVLTAMNRNLQTRLDILDRQLELRGAGQLARTAANGGEFALADSRRELRDNIMQANER